MNIFSRSWMITKLTFGVINKDRELIGFAFLAAFFSMIFAVCMVFPTIITSVLNEGFNEETMQVYHYIILFVTYFGMAFIATFFNVCVVNTTKIRFEGGNATFADSIRFAFSKLGLIAKWSLLSASVGLLLRLLQNFASRFGKGGQIVANLLISMLGLAWSVVSIFVVPVLVYENLGPIDALKRSTAIIKKTWGESLVKSIGLGVIQFFAFLIICLIFAGLTYLLTINFEIIGLLIGVSLGAITLLLAGLIFSVANTIFNTALYVYANSNTVADGFNEQVMHDAFKTK